LYTVLDVKSVDLCILPFPPTLAGPGEIPQVYNKYDRAGCSVDANLLVEASMRYCGG